MFFYEDSKDTRRYVFDEGAMAKYSAFLKKEPIKRFFEDTEIKSIFTDFKEDGHIDDSSKIDFFCFIRQKGSDQVEGHFSFKCKFEEIAKNFSSQLKSYKNTVSEKELDNFEVYCFPVSRDKLSKKDYKRTLEVFKKEFCVLASEKLSFFEFLSEQKGTIAKFIVLISSGFLGFCVWEIISLGIPLGTLNIDSIILLLQPFLAFMGFVVGSSVGISVLVLTPIALIERKVTGCNHHFVFFMKLLVALFVILVLFLIVADFRNTRFHKSVTVDFVVPNYINGMAVPTEQYVSIDKGNKDTQKEKILFVGNDNSFIYYYRMKDVEKIILKNKDIKKVYCNAKATSYQILKALNSDAKNKLENMHYHRVSKNQVQIINEYEPGESELCK